MEMPRNLCQNCGHTWIQRKDGVVKYCPCCHHTDWSSPNNRRSYGFGKIAVNQEVLFPWEKDERANESLNQAINSYSHRTRRKFKKIVKAYGLLLRRIE